MWMRFLPWWGVRVGAMQGCELGSEWGGWVVTLFNSSVLSSSEFINWSAQCIHVSSLCVLRVCNLFCNLWVFLGDCKKILSSFYKAPECARCKGLWSVSSSLSLCDGLHWIRQSQYLVDCLINLNRMIPPHYMQVLSPKGKLFPFQPIFLEKKVCSGNGVPQARIFFTLPLLPFKRFIVYSKSILDGECDL